MIPEIYNWIINHPTEILQGYLAIVGLASVIVKLTPTLKDDTVLKAIVKFVGKFMAINTSISAKKQREANKK